MKTLFRGGPIRGAESADMPDWVLIEDDLIAGVGAADDVPGADNIVDLEGGTLTVAFCDAHVHLPATGLYRSGMDLRGEKSAEAILAAFGQRAERNELLFGGNFEDPLDAPLTRHELDQRVGDRPALLARADMHSCIVSTALLDRLDVRELEGVDKDSDGSPTGYLREEAAAQAWRWFENDLPRAQQLEAMHAAVQSAYERGVVRVHEMYVVEWRGWDSLDLLKQVAEEVALDVSPYVATTDVRRVVAMGFDRIGGDWFLDGSFGSHTAWLQEPYPSAVPEGSPPAGIQYRTDDEVFDFFSEAQGAGLQVGVHAIGDAAIEQALRAWERVAEVRGMRAVRNLQHRIEHFECATDDQIRRAARLNIAASIQPAFDLFWGGTDKLYADRIGPERALRMNRFRSMQDAGLVLGAGSDSTVTPMDPFLQMRALRTHHVEEERLSAEEAFRAHTWGSQQMSRSGQAGTLTPGVYAGLAWLDRDPVSTEPDDLTATEVLGVWCRGRRTWPQTQAEVR